MPLEILPAIKCIQLPSLNKRFSGSNFLTPTVLSGDDARALEEKDNLWKTQTYACRENLKYLRVHN